MSDTATIRAMRVRKRHFEYASDEVYEPSRFRESETETRIRERAYGYQLAWITCDDTMWRVEK